LESPERKERRPGIEHRPLSELFLWGIITHPHGLQGHVLVRVLAEHPTSYPLRTFWVAGPHATMAEPKLVASIQPHTSHSPQDPKAEPLWRLRLKGIENRESAECLRRASLYLPRNFLPPLPPGHFYYLEAENAQVMDIQEGLKGKLQAIIPGAAYDFFIVAGFSGETYWIPAPFVLRLDKETTPPTLWVEGPAGLWDPDLAKGQP